MSSGLKAKIGALVMGVALLGGLAAHAQEHVRLMPQLGTGYIRSVAFSPDGRFVLTGSADDTARSWDAATGQQIRTFTGHTEGVLSVAFSADGRYVLIGSHDTTAGLWDAATGKQLATLLSFEDGGWAVTDSAGRYDASDPNNVPGLIWVTDSLRTIELKQLKDNYYTPNLLASIIKGERLPEYREQRGTAGAIDRQRRRIEELAWRKEQVKISAFG